MPITQNRSVTPARNAIAVTICALVTAHCYEPSAAYIAAECLDGESDKPPCPAGYVCSDEYECVKECSLDSHCADEFEEGVCGTCIANTCRRVDCYQSECGNGIVDTREACDDGNLVDDDYCGSACLTITGRCGDGLLQENEACDDGNVASADYCEFNCQAVLGFCGDATVQSSEQCDDGNSQDGDYCSHDCQIATGRCGDAVLQANETCDDGLPGAPGDGCSEACGVEFGYSCDGLPSVCESTCGDGAKASNEGCDDNNNADSDGCSAECNLEPGYSCADGESEVCAPVCGDGLIVGAELCDDSDNDDNDWCDNDCVPQQVCEADSSCWPMLYTGSYYCYAGAYVTGCGYGTRDPLCSEIEFCGQDGHYRLGLKPEYEVQGDSGETVAYDARTGLFWQRHWVPLPAPDETLCPSAICGPVHAEIYCGTLVYAGYDDWRIPNMAELYSIVDFGLPGPVVDPDYFPELHLISSSEGPVRSSTSGPLGFGAVWPQPRGVSMMYGISLFGDLHSGQVATTVCVRSQPRPVLAPPGGERFAQQSDANGSMFFDLRTLLTWVTNTESSGSWSDSLAHCEGLEHGGRDDWRLPNIHELMSLISYDPLIGSSATRHPGGTSRAFWSSTISYYHNPANGIWNPVNAWQVDFYNANIIPKLMSSPKFARCVASGQ